MNVLILCTGNSCRSQIAQAYLQQFTSNEVNVYSAGIETHGVNPLTVEVLKEDGIDISKHTSNHIDEYKDIQFDYVITVCDNARETCPHFPSTAKIHHKAFQDPARVQGSKEEVLQQFREVRDKIKEFCREFTEVVEKY